MATSTKKIQLWRREVEHRPGILARTLEPMASKNTNLRVVMGYGFPGQSRAAIEVAPVTGARASQAAREGGLSPSTIPALLVEGENRAGLGHAFARAIADAGINIEFLVAQVVGGRYSAVFGFGSDADAERASALIKRAGKAPKKSARTSKKAKKSKRRAKK